MPRGTGLALLMSGIQTRRTSMKDKTEGKFDQVKGKVKEEIGDATGDRSTEWSGKADQAKGHVKEAVGDAKGEFNKGGFNTDKAEGKFDQAKGKVKEEVGDAMGDR